MAAVAAGATALHVHPRDDSGDETLEGELVAASLEVMRASVSVPIGVTTGAWLEPEPALRRRAIKHWKVLPDFASVNFHEDGAAQTARALLDRGVGLEAGIWSEAAAMALIETGFPETALRILLEPMEPTVAEALANVADIERRLHGVAPEVPRLLHGVDATAWPLFDRARLLGYDVRIGLEDTLKTPDGKVARDNAELVAIAAERLQR